jgi:transposase
MPLDHHSEEPTAIRTNLGAIFVSLELSRSTWLITSLSPGGGEKMSKHSVSAGDIAGLLSRFSELKQKAFARMGQSFPIIVIQEAGLDGFWIHRVLQSEGIESYVVDAASIATSRRRRRAKTDRIDGEALVRALLAYKRGEPRVCAMVRAPTPEDEDRRRLCRERKTLTVERVQHVNRIKDCCSPKVSPATSRCVAIDANGSSCCLGRSRPSRLSGTPYSPRRRRPKECQGHRRC